MSSPTHVTGALNATVAGEIRAEIHRRGWSQATLAKRMGVHEMWLSRRLKIHAPKPLTLGDLELIAAGLGRTPAELVASAIRAGEPTTLAEPARPDRPRDNRPKRGPDQRRKIPAIVPRRTRPLNAAKADALSPVAA